MQLATAGFRIRTKVLNPARCLTKQAYSRSLSAPCFAYVLRYDQMKPRRKRLINPDTLVLLKQIGIGLLVLSTVALIITGVWYGSRLQSLTISEVKVSGGETISHQLVKDIAWAEMQGQYLGLIPKQSAWFYPAENIKTELKRIERITNISVILINSKELQITFDEYVPFALWCNTVDSKDCLFVDESGYAFAKAPNLTGGSFLRLSKIGTETKLQTEMVSKDEFLKLIETKKLLEEKGWFVSQIEVDKEGDAYLGLSPHSELKISSRQTPLETVDNLFTVLSTDEFSTLKPGDFNYIDLRYGNKVFVKVESDEAISQEATSSATTTELE